jgi:hypothetical protein
MEVCSGIRPGNNADLSATTANFTITLHRTKDELDSRFRVATATSCHYQNICGPPGEE